MSAEVAASGNAEEENNVLTTGEEGENGSPDKKETFQWNTPADEFAEDVGSDIDEESEDEGEGNKSGRGRTGDESTEGEMELHYSEVANGQIDVKHDPSPKKARAKNQFPCPKCNKVWNWPWELRRHLVMHFKEVRNILLCFPDWTIN